mmetsp:Transcript_28290/g.71790  ORF Transcript_28290/g.71790 Transcript_28290/m.71790 type:complete len:200 (+) Transcript_28290:3063-3662(+)
MDPAEPILLAQSRQSPSARGWLQSPPLHPACSNGDPPAGLTPRPWPGARRRPRHRPAPPELLRQERHDPPRLPSSRPPQEFPEPAPRRWPPGGKKAGEPLLRPQLLPVHLLQRAGGRHLRLQLIQLFPPRGLHGPLLPLSSAGPPAPQPLLLQPLPQAAAQQPALASLLQNLLLFSHLRDLTARPLHHLNLPRPPLQPL